MLLPLLAQFKDNCKFEKIIVVPFTGNKYSGPELDYEDLLAAANMRAFASINTGIPISLAMR